MLRQLTLMPTASAHAAESLGSTRLTQWRPVALGSGSYAAAREAGSPDRDVGDWKSGIRELVAQFSGHTDDGWFSPRMAVRCGGKTPSGRSPKTDVLFVAGCEENQAQFHTQFDHIILLSAPLEVLAGRLATRTGNPYGKAPEELSRIVDDIQTVEPLLRRVADHEVQTTIPLNEVVTTILHLVDA
jgi:hypothetical protein